MSAIPGAPPASAPIAAKKRSRGPKKPTVDGTLTPVASPNGAATKAPRLDGPRGMVGGGGNRGPRAPQQDARQSQQAPRAPQQAQPPRPKAVVVPYDLEADNDALVDVETSMSISKITFKSFLDSGRLSAKTAAGIKYEVSHRLDSGEASQNLVPC